MSGLKKLASQTAIYGLSSILGRTLNFLLVILHTRVLGKEAYGINTDLYVIIAFLAVVLSFGMETTFFRFANKKPQEKEQVYASALFFIVCLLAFFFVILGTNFGSLSQMLRYTDYPYLLWIGMSILALDVLSALPFARLRLENRAWRFASIRLLQIGLTIVLNLVVFLLPITNWGLPSPLDFPNGATYIFVINLLASGFMTLLLLPQLFAFRPSNVSGAHLKTMLAYSSPLVIGGLAGTVNEMLDRQMIKYILPKETSMQQVGIYGAVYKISIFMTLFIQAFRYAAEPFFFQSAQQKNAPKTYALVLKYFVFAMALMLFGIVACIDLAKLFVGEDFREGIYVVPFLLAANFFLGVQVNLSIWFKVTDKTRFGAYISIVGALITVVLNLILIPELGYFGAAITTLVCYFSIAAITFILGQKHYPIPYETGKILLVMLSCFGCAALSFYVFRGHILINLILGILLLSVIFLSDHKNILALLKR